MSFRVTARTILQLGAELISSDSVAFYELIKNAFDAGSRRVFIDVCVRMNHGAYLSHNIALRNGMADSPAGLETLRQRILADIDTSAPGVDLLKRRIKRAQTPSTLSRWLEEANYVQVRDRGHGMSVEDLDEIYLTIGTPHRRRQREEQSRHGNLRPILGEKGLGRLSCNEARLALRRFHNR